MASITATIKVSVDDLRRQSTVFGNKASEVKRLTDDMLNLIDGTNSVWQGEAQQTYKKQFDGLRDDMAKIYKMIDEYRLDLSDIAKNYEAAEISNKSAAATLKSDVIH